MSSYDADQAAHDLEVKYDNSDEYQKVQRHHQKAQNDPELGEVLMDAMVKYHLKD